MERCKNLLKRMSLGRRNADWVLTEASELGAQLRTQLPNLCVAYDLVSIADDISGSLVEMFACIEEEEKCRPIRKRAQGAIDRLSREFEEIGEELIEKELLDCADVIFCTLSSAGSSTMNMTGRVDDLIVDEAAAATEPELSIPFHLRPRRLFAVGDHMQLPATVLSQQAGRLGLDKSLHERLIWDCNHKHIMLDTQYRMRPEISRFPSANFYGGKIANGDNVAQDSYRRRSGETVAMLPYTFIQVRGAEQQTPSGSFKNEQEASAVVSLLGQLKDKIGRQRGWASINKVRVVGSLCGMRAV